MTELICKDSFFAVSSIGGTVAVNLRTTPYTDISISSAKPKSSEKTIVDGRVDITCSAVSDCCKFFVFGSHKDLELWEICGWSQTWKKPLKRAASTIKFTPKGDKIVVADKSGDVYLFTLHAADTGELILGHVSMILDILVTPDEKFIISCDRDEKIRVSRFPESYCIQSFCLGHKEFILSICLLSHDKSILLSGGGDGTIKFWDYVNGIELRELECVLGEPEDDKVSQAVILKINSFSLENTKSVICVSHSNLLGFSLYLIQTENGLNCSLLRTVKLGSEPLAISINESDNTIWALSLDLKLCVYKMSDADVFIHDDERVDKLNKLIEKHRDVLTKATSVGTFLGSLFKKTFDNVREYLKRKEERMEADVKKIRVDL